MKLLKDILYRSGIEEMVGNPHKAIDAVTFDSRKVRHQSLYIAQKGTKVDGHSFIAQAVADGATAVVCEVLPDTFNDEVTYVRVKDSNIALAVIASNFYDNPSKNLKLVGITGTNGKTTVASLLFRMYRSLGYKCGLLSTVAVHINNEIIPATHTTPDALQINRMLSEMVSAGCKYAFMEVSSHGIAQKRIDGLHFTGAVFTNISHDHLDYHGSFDDYILAKKRFFDLLEPSAFALTNKDDRHGDTMVKDCEAKIYRYALRNLADYRVKVLDNDFSGLHLNLNGKEVHTRLIGSFNAYNLLAVYAAACLLGEEEMQVLTSVSTLNAVDGRFQYLKSTGGITGIVDYAHTPDALKNVLQTIQDIRTGNEQVITLVGCGGDRDREKRPVMAEIATRFSSKVLLTSDNPRTEDPELILADMEKGLEPQLKSKAIKITNRQEAIKTACMLAKPGDIILVAGKGHEKYQEINGVRHDFDDVQILKETFQNLGI